MNHETHEETSSQTSSRRQLLRAVLASGAAIASVRAARAQDTKPEDAGQNPPLAPADLTQDATRGSNLALDPENLPRTARIRAVRRAGSAERNDADILNYALSLEYLEAEFYSRVVQADDARSFLTGRPKEFARVLARDENTHVGVVTEAIRNLGGTPIEKPEFQFPANAFISQIGFLNTAAALEETGVSAYLGQGANVKRKDVLNFAATIYGNETRHTGLIRFFLGDAIAARDLELPLSRAQIFERVRPFLVNPPADVSALTTPTAPSAPTDPAPQ